ncbi:MAG: GNAT family N-acetyltransferase [Firmicutes bacterium]|nr:GNAT family N-acetyltransferase [Bacillota bacterium]
MLTGHLVHLRPVEPEDLDHFMQWVNDPEVTQYLASFSWPLSRMAEREWVENAAKGGHSDERNLVIETLDGKYLGVIGLRHIDWRNRHAEVGIVIGNKGYWGKGYGTDALRVLARFAFDQLNLHTLTLALFADNLRARRSYEKVGFKPVGTFRQYRYLNGAYHDELFMQLLPEDLKENRTTAPAGTSSGSGSATSTSTSTAGAAECCPGG